MKKEEIVKNTWLIQRLKRPYNQDNKINILLSGMSFGGGLINGGLSAEIMAVLSKIFSFDYMGSAEIEYGAVPKTLTKIYKNRERYKVQSMEIGGKTIYIYAPEWDGLKQLLEDIYNREHRLKEWAGFRESLDGEEYSDNIIGWLELDNGFFFFKDKNAFDEFVGLFIE